MLAIDYLKAIVQPLLRHPDNFSVVETQDAMGVLLTVNVHKDDMGIIVGKGGETARSIRHLARIVGVFNSARVSVRINEPSGSTYKNKQKSND